MHNHKWINYLFIILAVLIPLFFVFYDSGLIVNIQAEKHVNTTSPIIGDFFPANRLNNDKDNWIIQQEPIYFTSRLPYLADNVDVSLDFTYQSCDTLKIGLQQKSTNTWSYQLQTIYNESFDNLQWPKIEQGKYTLWQRKIKYNSFNDFFNRQIKDSENIASYNMSYHQKFKINNYSDWPELKKINYVLRGDYSFYTYIKKGLYYKLEILDYNRAINEDNIVINIKDENGKIIDTQRIADDGYSVTGVATKAKRYIDIRKENLPEGVYLVEFIANYDIFTSSIETRHRYLTFNKNLYLANSTEYLDGNPKLPVQENKLVTNSTTIEFYTSHSSGLQTVQINNVQLPIKEVKRKYSVGKLKGLSAIKIPKSDMMLSGNGLWAFDWSMFFEPNINSLEIINNNSNFDYFIAEYVAPPKKGTLASGKVNFSLNNAAIDNNKLRFIISCPGSSLEKPLLISKVAIQYHDNRDWQQRLKLYLINNYHNYYE